jgi:3-oxoacyl-[acyl-carrier protein] reductase
MVEAGYRVLGTATTEAGAENISALLGGKGRGYVVDLAVQQSVSNFLEALKQDQETPLILVNNAGITKDNLLMRMKAEEWHDVIATNLSGVFQLTQGLLRGMMKAKFGRVINLSSVVGRMGNGGQSNYAASKAGIEGFSRALGAEVASRNITVNSVAPGFIETDMTTALSSDQRSAMLARVPAARLGLASEDASYITGETLHINGGMYTA